MIFIDWGSPLKDSEYTIYGHSGPFYMTLPKWLHFNSSCSYPVSRDTLWNWSHAGESVLVLFSRKIIFQSLGMKEKTPESCDHDKCDIPLYSTFLIPSTIHHCFHFTNKKQISKLNVSKKWWSNIILVKFHINFGISFFFSVVKHILGVWSC